MHDPSEVLRCLLSDRQDLVASSHRLLYGPLPTERITVERETPGDASAVEWSGV